MIIDGHMHVWPDKIAGRALGSPTSGLRRFGDGTVDSARETLERGGVDRGVCLAVADAPERLEAANRFVGQLPQDRFIGFGSVHPGRTPEENRASLRENGLRGVKVHPLFQGFSLDDRRLWDILDALRGEFVAVLHVGREEAEGENTRATPRMVADIARAFPDLDVIAAHFGGYHAQDEAEEDLRGVGVYVDTSWPPGIASLGSERVRALIDRHGAERVVFASDWPMADPGIEAKAIRDLGLGDTDTDAILGGNLARLLGLATTEGAAA